MPDSGDGFTRHLRQRLSEAEAQRMVAESRAAIAEEKLAAAQAALAMLSGCAELDEPPPVLVHALSSPSPKPFQGVKLSDREAVALRRDRPPGDPAEAWRKLRAAIQ